MTYTVHDNADLAAALITRLVSETARQVGDAEAPDTPVTPYCVVYPLPDLASEGPLPDPTEQVASQIQVTCVGSDRDEAQWMQSKVREALLGWTPTIPGVGTFPMDLAQGSGVTRNPEHKTLFYTTDRFRADQSA